MLFQFGFTVYRHILSCFKQEKVWKVYLTEHMNTANLKMDNGCYAYNISSVKYKSEVTQNLHKMKSRILFFNTTLLYLQPLKKRLSGSNKSTV